MGRIKRDSPRANEVDIMTINLAVSIGLLEEKEVIQFLDEVPSEVHIYMTGRDATEGLKQRADFVNEINMLKGPKKLVGEKGIDF